MSSAVDRSFLRSRATQRRVAAVTVACALGSGVYALLLPKWYSSAVTVVSAKPQSGGSGALSSLLGGSGGGLGPGLFEGSLLGADAARIEAVLQSVAVTDAVIDRFDLRARYDQKYQESTREELWRHCSTRTLPKPNLVELTCEDKDPKFVQLMLAYFAEYGNQVFRRVSVSSASEEVRFLERRVEELRKQADDLADRMRAFQEEHKIVDLDTQAKAVVSSIATLNAQRISKQLELDYARTYSSGDEPTAKQLESQLSVVGRKLRDLEEPAPAPGSAAPQAPASSRPGSAASQAPASSSSGMFPPALEVPKLRAEFETLLRDRKVAEATLIYALERLEGARASAARDVSTFLVLDPPPLPTRKSRPKRALIVGMITLLGLAAVLAYEAWRAGALQPLARERTAPPGSPTPPVRDIRRG